MGSHEPESVANFLRSLRSADEIVASLKGLISRERLLELAGAGYMPSHLVDGTTHVFVLSDVKEYVLKHLIVESKGMAFPTMTLVPVPVPTLAKVPPAPLRHIYHLQWVAAKTPFPGVYFLVAHGEVVYVGQSTNVYARIGAHTDKFFQDVFWFPVPVSELDAVEGAFIRLLRPALNLRANGAPVAPGRSCWDEAVLQKYQSAVAEGISAVGAHDQSGADATTQKSEYPRVLAT